VFHSCPHTHWPLLECSSVALTHAGFFSSVLRLSTDVFGPSRMFFRFSDVRWCFLVFYSCQHAHWSLYVCSVLHSCPHTHWPLLECSSVALTHTGFFSSVLRLSTDVFGPSRVFFRFSDMRWCFCSVLQLSARALIHSVVFYSCPHAHWSFRNVLHVSACTVAISVVFYSCPQSH
jgi:hypothetical protein